MRKILVCYLVVVSTCLAQRGDIFEDLTRKVLLVEPSFVWPTTVENAAEGKIRTEDVLRLFQDLFPLGALEQVYAMEGFRFVPLEKERKDKLYLVAVTDVTGRAFFNKLQVVWCEGRRCRMTGEVSDGDNDLDEQLVDVNSDGAYEIITKQFAGSYDGASTRPIYLYYIRELVDGQLVDVSKQFPAYFREHILPMMETDKKEMSERLEEMSSKPAETLVEAPALSPSEEAARSDVKRSQRIYRAKVAAELQYVQDEYHRRVLGEKTAGLENAIRWARSDDPEIQSFAIGVLEPIDSPLAAAELDKMSRSPGISWEAKNALDNRRQAGLAAVPVEKK